MEERVEPTPEDAERVAEAIAVRFAAWPPRNFRLSAEGADELAHAALSAYLEGKA